ncbi:helix-turn-helix domain-containing protein [Lentibacillus sediminis]|uniref:helix-turn-helix domain-containing protein n=1 Tax=Lentibacillus sediminis TaxID=1940529 RepID=UPI000C1C5A0C|nr:helix-turn-helix transcriptional regulator [Lentibacillus sediminis]
MDRKRIGRRVKGFRKLKGYTQMEFAKKLDVSISLIGGVERGTRQVSEEFLTMTADALEIAKEELTLEEAADQTGEEDE